MNIRQSIWPNYAPPDIAFERGEGRYLYTHQGERYLDLTSGIGVTSLGHSHPELIATLKQQSDKLWHLSNMFRITNGELLMQKLCQLSFGESVFLANSGAEALEAAIKAARRYQFDKGQTGKYNIIGFDSSFHGRTIATVAASGNKAYCKGFIPFNYGFLNCEWNNIEQLKSLMDSTVAAVLIEPIQGEGGVRVASLEFMQQLEQLCRERDILLIVDEVQCGIYRTGKPFCYQHYQIKPDIMTLAKGLGCGIPIGACVTTKSVGQVMVLGTHGSTFGGNPLASAVALKVLEIMERPEFAEHFAVISAYLHHQLQQWQQKHPKQLLKVVGKGLMIGLLFDEPNVTILKKLRDNKVLVTKCGHNLVRLLPPLNTTKQEIDLFIQKLDCIL